MKTHLVYATANPGKVIEIGRRFGYHGLTVSKFSDFVDLHLDPEENGISLCDNARIKAQAHAEALSSVPALRGDRFVVIADDTGIFIDGLHGEPGIHVRRWKGHRMTDEAIIAHTLLSMKGFSREARHARFRTALCMIQVDETGRIGELITAVGALDGHILETDDPRRIAGFPFASLFFADEYGMILGDLYRLPDEEKRTDKLNHRERAIENAIPVIMRMMM